MSSGIFFKNGGLNTAQSGTLGQTKADYQLVFQSDGSYWSGAYLHLWKCPADKYADIYWQFSYVGSTTIPSLMMGTDVRGITPGTAVNADFTQYSPAIWGTQNVIQNSLFNVECNVEHGNTVWTYFTSGYGYGVGVNVWAKVYDL